MNTNDEIKHLKNFNNALAVKVDEGIQEIERLTNQLHAYEKQWTDMDYTIGHLRQENAELKAEVVELRNLLEKSMELLNEVAAFGNCDCDIPNGKTCVPCESAMHNKRVREHLNPQPTQDPATAK